MKAVALFNLLFAFLAAAAAAAADINPLDVMKQLPQCGLACLVNGVTEHGCDIENFECQCNKVQEIIATVAPCLAQAGCGLDNITSECNRARGVSVLISVTSQGPCMC